MAECSGASRNPRRSSRYNMGKGAALRRGIQEATGTSSLFRMPSEYDPAEYPLMIEPLIQGKRT